MSSVWESCSETVRGLHPVECCNRASTEIPVHIKTGSEGQLDLKLSKMQSVSHRMGVLTVVERLRNQHGQVTAHKLALLEQQRARRARCRKRFDFWGTVAMQIERVG
jgi:hypothetical protein